MGEYIIFYNEKRPHTYLRYRTPNKAEADLKAINDQVGKNGVASRDLVETVITQIDRIKEMMGTTDEGEILEGSIFAEINSLKELIGANAEGDEATKGSILEEIETLKELIGANAEGDEEARGGVLEELAELRKLIGDQAEGDEEARGGILEEIDNIKDMLGEAAEGENPATGLQKEIEDILSKHNIKYENKKEDLFLLFFIGFCYNK